VKRERERAESGLCTATVPSSCPVPDVVLASSHPPALSHPSPFPMSKQYQFKLVLLGEPTFMFYF
jgi:hypothetical protein